MLFELYGNKIDRNIPQITKFDVKNTFSENQKLSTPIYYYLNNKSMFDQESSTREELMNTETFMR